MRLGDFVQPLDNFETAFRFNLIVSGNRLQPMGDFFECLQRLFAAQVGKYLVSFLGVGERVPALRRKLAFYRVKQIDHG